LKFLELSIDPLVSIKEAMESAGYENLSKDQLYDLARKITKKYELATLDGRNIFIDIGFGPRTVAERIRHIANYSASEMVALQATKLAAQATRLISEPEQAHTGVKIIINCAAPGDTPASAPTGPGAAIRINQEPDPRPAMPAKPLQITK
jgi:hypothetical protein